MKKTIKNLLLITGVLSLLTITGCSSTDKLKKENIMLKEQVLKLGENRNNISRLGLEYRIMGLKNSGPLIIFNQAFPIEMDNLKDWQKQLAKKYRVLTFNRAGYGKSKALTMPRTPETVAKELKILLTELGLKGPYVMVGPSLGGYYARTYAHLYKDEVKAIVLVDNPVQDVTKKLSTEFTEVEKKIIDDNADKYVYNNDFGKIQNSELLSIFRHKRAGVEHYDFDKQNFNENIYILSFDNTQPYNFPLYKKMKKDELRLMKKRFENYKNVKHVYSNVGHDILTNDTQKFMDEMDILMAKLK